MRILKSQLKSLIESLLLEVEYAEQKSAGYKYKRDGEDIFIIKSPKSKSTTEKNPIKVKKGTKEYNAISKLFPATDSKPSKDATDSKPSKDEKVKGKIILGLRSISGPDLEPGSGVVSRALSVTLDNFKELFDAYDVESPVRPGHSAHAFIYVENSSGQKTTYSGKSGIVFTLVDLLERLSIGRDLSTDEKLMAIRDAYQAGKATREEFEQALETTSWGPLRKLKNWDADSIDKATELIQVMPLKYDTQAEFDDACMRIESAYSNYNEDVPYDPLPGTKEAGPDARNSNSFAYTLLLEAISPDADEKNLKSRIANLDPSKLPGWGYKVSGLESDITGDQLRALGMPVS